MLDMMSIITTLVHIFVKGPAEKRLRLFDCLALLKIHCRPLRCRYRCRLVNINIAYSSVTFSPEIGHVIILIGTSCSCISPAGFIDPMNYKYDINHRIQGSLHLGFTISIISYRLACKH